jgi:uncharacterized protein
MKFYLDASFVVSLFMSDAHSPKADRWIAGRRDFLIVSELCALEFAAGVSRGVRAARLSENAATEALRDFDEWRAGAAGRLAAGRGDLALAETLVRDFSTKLAAPDAIHLATAINSGSRLVTFDDRFGESARSRGVAVETLV